MGGNVADEKKGVDNTTAHRYCFCGSAYRTVLDFNDNRRSKIYAVPFDLGDRRNGCGFDLRVVGFAMDKQERSVVHFGTTVRLFIQRQV